VLSAPASHANLRRTAEQLCHKVPKLAELMHAARHDAPRWVKWSSQARMQWSRQPSADELEP